MQDEHYTSIVTIWLATGVMAAIITRYTTTIIPMVGWGVFSLAIIYEISKGTVSAHNDLDRF